LDIAASETDTVLPLIVIVKDSLVPLNHIPATKTTNKKTINTMYLFENRLAIFVLMFYF